VTYVYDLTPEALIESDAPLSVDEVGEARAALEGDSTLADVASSLDARVYEPPPPPPPRVRVDLEALLEHIKDDEVLDVLVGIEGARTRLARFRRHQTSLPDPTEDTQWPS
jgi:hypothetical protein